MDAETEKWPFTETSVRIYQKKETEVNVLFICGDTKAGERSECGPKRKYHPDAFHCGKNKSIQNFKKFNYRDDDLTSTCSSNVYVFHTISINTFR